MEHTMLNILDLISIAIIVTILAIALIAMDKQKEDINPFTKAYNLAITTPICCGALIGIAAGCTIWVIFHPSLIPFLLSLTK